MTDQSRRPGDTRPLSRILVPLDGSSLAQRALPQAEALARATGARMLLVRVVCAGTCSGGSTGASWTDEVRGAKTYLDTLVEQLLDRGITAQGDVAYGEVAEWILEEAVIRQADLIAMTTSHFHGPRRSPGPGIAEKVLAEAPVPVLVVRTRRAERVAAHDLRSPRLLVPLDGSTHAETALAVARSWARDLSGELLLVRAVPEPHAYGIERAIAAGLEGEELVFERGEAEAYLGPIATGLREAGIDVRTEARAGAPAAVIGEVAREQGADFIVMATRGCTGTGALPLGSVALTVLRQGGSPLVLVPPTYRAGTVMPAAPSREAVGITT